MAKKTKAAKSRKGAKGTKDAAPKAAKVRERDPRLPAAGTTMTRTYKSKDYKVAVLEDGFRYDGAEYRSLSALASKISGAASVNGFLWFGLVPRKVAAPAPAPAKSRRAPKVRDGGKRSKNAATPATGATPESGPSADEAAHAE